jgi:hypothetical protein
MEKDHQTSKKLRASMDLMVFSSKLPHEIFEVYGQKSVVSEQKSESLAPFKPRRNNQKNHDSSLFSYPESQYVDSRGFI